MSPEPHEMETSIVAVNPESSTLVELAEIESANSQDAVKLETEALIEALKKRAQAEIHMAGDLTRETYLNAVRQAREAIEQNKLIDPDRIEQSVQAIQQEAEKNWNVITGEIESLGTRLSDAAKAAWDKLMQPQNGSNSQ
jgi:hypothetical protein